MLASPWSQLGARFPYRVRGGGRVVALTFDDGPNPPFTERLADVLADEGVRATFFQVGACVARNPEVTRRLFHDGHLIGNHSMHHRFRDYLRHPGFDRELEDTQDTIRACIGRRPALFRPPWLWRGPLWCGGVRRAGLVPVSGEFCHSGEVLGASGARIARAVLRRARPGLIVIFHDGFNASTADRAATVEAVRLAIPELRRRGYRFVTVDELLGAPGYLPEAGVS
ncbi:MAG: polysaccharide deacetylase family protein [Thermoleophilia bacterium]